MLRYQFLEFAIVLLCLYRGEAQKDIPLPPPPPPPPPPLAHLNLRQSTMGNPNFLGKLTDDAISAYDKQFRVVYEWRTLDFAYRSDYDRGMARKRGNYIEPNVIVSDVKAFAKRLYVALPRLLPGVPATLGWIIAPDNNGRTDPLIEPFPSWEMNRVGDCRALQFVQGIEIDGDGLLWVIDSGRLFTLTREPPPIICPPKVMIFDLKRNGSIVNRYDFPNEVVNHGTNYLNRIVVDDPLTGFAYITDNSGLDPGIVVYSRLLNKSWKIREPNSMRAAPNAVDFSVNGTQLRFSIHIDGIALGPYYSDGTNLDRNVYYSPLSSYHLYSLPASVLRNVEFARTGDPTRIAQLVTDYGVKASQSDGMIMDNRGVLYYGLLKENAIAKWNSFQPFTMDNQQIIAKDDQYIQWVDGMAFDENGYLYVVVNRLFNFIAGRLNPNEVNFRILRAKTAGGSYVMSNPPELPRNFITRRESEEFMNPYQRRNFFFNSSSKVRSQSFVMSCLGIYLIFTIVN